MSTEQLPKLNAVPRAALAPATFPKTAIPKTGIKNPIKNRQCSGMHNDLNSRKRRSPTMASVKNNQGTPINAVLVGMKPLLSRNHEEDDLQCNSISNQSNGSSNQCSVHIGLCI